jgi:hypothetical protein
MFIDTSSNRTGRDELPTTQSLRRGQVSGVSGLTTRARHSVATAARSSVFVLNDLLAPRATDERQLIPTGAAGISRFRRGPHKRRDILSASRISW